MSASTPHRPIPANVHLLVPYPVAAGLLLLGLVLSVPTPALARAPHTYPAGSTVATRLDVSDGTLDCEWGWTCDSQGVPVQTVFHHQLQENLGRVSGDAQHAHWMDPSHRARFAYFALFPSTYREAQKAYDAIYDYFGSLRAMGFTLCSAALPSPATPAHGASFCARLTIRGEGTAFAMDVSDGTREVEAAMFSHGLGTAMRTRFLDILAALVEAMRSPSSKLTATGATNPRICHHTAPPCPLRVPGVTRTSRAHPRTAGFPVLAARRGPRTLAH